MPIVTLRHDASVPPDQLRAIVAALRDVVPVALDCDEERFDGTLRPGDLNLAAVPGLTPVGGLGVVVEIHTRDLPSRAADRDRRAAVVRRRVESVYPGAVGVWLVLATAGWSQTGDDDGAPAGTGG